MKYICPKCKREYYEPPVLSRDDNETEICPDCWLIESINDWFKHKENKE